MNAMRTGRLLNFYAGQVHYNPCMNKNVSCINLIKLWLCEGIAENLFATSACGLTLSLPRTHMSPATRGWETLLYSKTIPFNSLTILYTYIFWRTAQPSSITDISASQLLLLLHLLWALFQSNLSANNWEARGTSGAVISKLFLKCKSYETRT